MKNKQTQTARKSACDICGVKTKPGSQFEFMCRNSAACKRRQASADLLELAKAIILESGLIEALHNQPPHPRAWQNQGERWANMARAAISKFEGA